MLGERIASQSEVITAIVSGYSPCVGAHPVLSERECKKLESCGNVGRWPAASREPIAAAADTVVLIGTLSLRLKDSYVLSK